jgi:hypothetical protein
MDNDLYFQYSLLADSVASLITRARRRLGSTPCDSRSSTASCRDERTLRG